MKNFHPSSFYWARSESTPPKLFFSKIKQKSLDLTNLKVSMTLLLSRRFCTYFYFSSSFKIDGVMSKNVCDKKSSWWVYHRFFSSHWLPCIFFKFFTFFVFLHSRVIWMFQIAPVKRRLFIFWYFLYQSRENLILLLFWLTYSLRYPRRF